MTALDPELCARLVAQARESVAASPNFSTHGTRILPAMADQLEAALAEVARLTGILHAMNRHPDYEYETTKGPRKSWDNESPPPDGAGWKRNIHEGRNGWERFDFHEEAYWMRKVLT